ncbi:unnamed protein product [Toxocara canis]|uniref:SLC3A2_N domain-containing protein n=1 Tax=Toxocara canis TaxID=6265 RepID=A0A183UZS9_TOXCA|nr:unnamed protein product [Toxocara canis]
MLFQRRRGKKKKRREQSPHSISPQLYTGKEKSDTEISPTDISYKSERSVHDAGLKQRRKYQRAKKSVSTRSLAANETRDIGVGISADEAEPQNLCHHCNSLTSMPRLYPQASEYLYDKYDQSAAGAIVPAMPSIVFELEQVPSKKLYYCRWTVYWLLWVMTILLFYLLINRDYYCQFLDANAS